MLLHARPPHWLQDRLGGHPKRTSSSDGPLLRVTSTLPSASTAVWRGQTGSMFFLLIVQILSHSWYVQFRDAPWEGAEAEVRCVFWSEVRCQEADGRQTSAFQAGNQPAIP